LLNEIISSKFFNRKDFISTTDTNFLLSCAEVLSVYKDNLSICNFDYFLLSSFTVFILWRNLMLFFNFRNNLLFNNTPFFWKVKFRCVVI